MENTWTKVSRPAIESSMLAICQYDHFSKTMKPGVFYSLKADSSATVQSLFDFFDQPSTEAALTKRKRNLGIQHGMRSDVDSGVDCIHPDGNLYFRMGMPRLGYKKTMKVASGMGHKSSCFIVTLDVIKSASWTYDCNNSIEHFPFLSHWWNMFTFTANHVGKHAPCYWTALTCYIRGREHSMRLHKL